MKKKDNPIIAEETYRAPVQQVWNALTHVNEMRQWYFSNIPEFKRESCIGGWDYFLRSNLKKYLEF